MATWVQSCHSYATCSGEPASSVAVPVGAFSRQEPGASMANIIVVGAQWGDEGKGHPSRPTEQMNPPTRQWIARSQHG